MSGEEIGTTVPLPQRVNSKIEEIGKAQAATRVEVESIVKVLYPEAMYDNKAKLDEAVKDPKEQGWFDKARYKLNSVLKFEQDTASILRRLRNAIEPQGGPKQEVEEIARDLNV